MRRRTEHLVEKRDGRREFLRATKLARSIHLALFDAGVDEDWRALELASVLLEGLRSRHEQARSTAAGAAVVMTTSEIAEAVQQLLVVTGQPAAAARYGAMQSERARRRGSVAMLSPQDRGVGDRAVAARAIDDRGARSVEVGDRMAGRWPGEG